MGRHPHTTLCWQDVAGSKWDGTYICAEYRGMWCELRLTDKGWEWSFYDDTSYDPELAVARSDEGAEYRDDAEADLLDYIDGYIHEKGD